MTSSGQFALVTGASSGIGEAFAVKLASMGYNIILTARREELLEKLAKTIEEKYQVDTVVVVADLSLPEGIAKVTDELKKHTNLFYLINNAGYANIGVFEETTWEKHDKMLS
ncbi:MAG: SDR family NAD(P)-dependent oxidoreductase, partial [Candidatus Kariarchaeaceae archaeon]